MTEMAILIVNAVRSLGQDKNIFVMIDSISTLLIYNDHRAVTKFIHFLISKLRIMNIDGILMTHRSLNSNEFLSQVMIFCDDAIEHNR